MRHRRVHLWTLRQVSDSAPTDTNADASANTYLHSYPWSTIAVDMSTSKLGQYLTGTVTTNTFSTSSSDELLLAFVASSGSSDRDAPTIPSVPGAGVAWTEVVGTNADARGSQARIFRAFAPSVITSQTVTASSSDTSSTMFIDVVAFRNVVTTGTNGSGAIGATASATGVSNDPQIALTTTRDNSWIWGVGADPQSDVRYATLAGPNQAINASGDNGYNKAQYWADKENSTTPSAGTRVTISTTLGESDVWEVAAVEILPA